MENNDADSFLLDKIGDYLNAIQECITFLNPEEVEGFQKCIINLFCFYKIYLDGWQSLIALIDPETNKKEDVKLEILHERYQIFLKGIKKNSHSLEKKQKKKIVPIHMYKTSENNLLHKGNQYSKNTHKNGKQLLEKINHLTKGIEACILELSVHDFILLQNTITSLFDLHGKYIKGWDVLNQTLKPEAYMSFQEYIESDEYLEESSLYSTDKKMKEIAYEMFMGSDVRLG